MKQKPTRSPVGQGRDRLLTALFDEFGQNGPDANLSMREVAERLGVHHTLLTYHFGSRPGLLRAVLTEARRRDNGAIAAMGKDLGFEALCRVIWRYYSDPTHEDRIRAFFHLVGLAVYEPHVVEGGLVDLDDLGGILEAAALREGMSVAPAQRLGILATSCLRGLLLQRLLTPTPEVEEAADRLIVLLGASVNAAEGE